MFESITDKLSQVFRTLRGTHRLSEKNIADALGEIRTALLSADVNFTVANNFIQRTRDRCLGKEVLQSVTPDQQFIKIVFDELVTLLGEREVPTLNAARPLKILIVGLHGSGKTTTVAKLARFLKHKAGFSSPLAVACDVYRPAAIDQLEQLSQQIGITCYTEHNTKDAIKITRDGLHSAQESGNDVILFDTAGRLQIDQDLIHEVQQIEKAVQPQEVFLVADGALGQEAANVAQKFREALPLTGIILTKLDGDTRAGAALSMKEITGIAIRYIGTGEKLDAFEIFHPERIAQRILGMGDVVSLVEKAQEQVDETKAKELEKKLKKGKFDMNDFLSQLQSIKNMGPLESLIKHLPGMHQLNLGPEANTRVQRTEAIIYSMTPKERANPGIIDGSRRLRIAHGSGTSVQDVNALLKSFKQMQTVMKKVKGSKVNLASLFGGR
ncbi:MAG: signal recognition particle protein [Verrucomicrobiota bacterium]|nr:MAG: signal recognition particle protein [Verrucomicrobiota bacterium]